jgi:hypothetical protein
VDRTHTGGLYRIALPNGRSAEISPEQVRRIARGLGDHPDESRGVDGSPPIVEALESLPAEQRADALAVVLLRFGGKQDVESIAHTCELSAWRVWQLEEAFRQALDRVSAPRSPNGGLLAEASLRS